MAGATYTTRVIVLRKTKLGESDLILTMLASDGSQVRAVAKGARKPQSPFASRLELYSVAEVLCATGRNLDIVKEARLLDGNDALRTDIERASAAACMAELVERVSQIGLEAPHLCDLTQTALSALGRAQADRIPLVVAAHLLKALAFSGLRPSLDECAVCSAPLSTFLENEDATLPVRFSVADGGVVCPTCSPHVQSTSVSSYQLAWMRALLYATFEQVLAMEGPPQTACDILQLCQQWCGVHVGSNLKSLRFLLASGLF